LILVIKRSVWRDFIENIMLAVILAMLVRTFLWTGYRVPTSSMAPTLLPGDFIFAFRLPYGIKLPLTETKLIVSPPERGEVVVFSFPDQPRVNYVKRVVGLPGDRVEIKNGILYINENEYKQEIQSYDVSGLPDGDVFDVANESAPSGLRRILVRKQGVGKSFGPLVVPPKEVFLLGDNRDASDDSRYWGTVPFDKIEGKVQLIWLSLDWSHRWGENRFPSMRRNRIFSFVK
jgi:signal peptidase I